MPDDEDALTGPAGRQVCYEAGHPGCRLPPVLTARVWLVDTLGAVSVHLGGGRPVQKPVVALPEAPVQ